MLMSRTESKVMSEKGKSKKTNKKTVRKEASAKNAFNDVMWVLVILLVTAGAALLLLEYTEIINLF